MYNYDNQLNAVSLFSGCGGLSLGFIDAGFNVVLSIDNDEKALEAYRYNVKSSHVINSDLGDKDTLKKARTLLRDTRVDAVIGGPPCQGFSLTGPRKLEDERNVLYRAYVDFIEAFKPRALLIENVPGLATLYGGRVKNDIILTFENLGYRMYMQVLNAAEYGIPQFRKRLFFVGIKKGLDDFSFPLPTHSEAGGLSVWGHILKQYVTCEDAIGDLPSLEGEHWEEETEYTEHPKTEYQKKMRGNCNVLYNHVRTNHKEHVVKVISLVPEGGNYKDLPEGVGESRKFNEAWTRYHSKKPSKTIDTGHRNHFHYKYNRVPTIRENARLQSFPDYFVFTGSKTSQNRQVGNAVPPLLAKHIALKINKTLSTGEIEDEIKQKV